MDPSCHSADQGYPDKRQNAAKKIRVKLPMFGRKSAVNDGGDDGGSGGRGYGTQGGEYSRRNKALKSPGELHSRGSREDLSVYNDRSESIEYLESTTSKMSQSSSLFGSGASSISSKFFRDSSYDNSIQLSGSSGQVRGSDVEYAQEDDVNKKFASLHLFLLDG